MRTVAYTAVLIAALTSPDRGGEAPQEADGRIDLFNGKDLEGWEILVGVPKEDVFSVVVEDGAPAIRISGEMVAGLATLREFENYHLELEFKWGPGRFGPRATLPHDSGLLYHGTDNYNPGSGWLESVEFGILEGGETGDCWSVPGAHGKRVVVDVEGEEIPADELRYPGDELYRFRPGGELRVGRMDGIRVSEDDEKPHGQWNRLDLYCLGQTSVHVVNGTVNMVLHGIRRRINGRENPLTRGRIQLQSEWAEAYFRNIRLRPIKEFPPAIREGMTRPPHNTISGEEQTKGWQLLFDGRTTNGWRGYRQEDMPDGWQARQGALVRTGKAGDIVTTDMFGDFELLFDWKVSHGGNSGVFYRAIEQFDGMAESAAEYEIRDHAFWLDDPYASAALYDLYPPETDAAHPAGYWNRGRIAVRDNRIEHWLNGERVVSCEHNSNDWKSRLEASKFRSIDKWAQADRGHIGIQDHGDTVWFRNLKIRPLPRG